MPRVARIVIPELPHHVTQRGNNGEAVFFTDDDRWLYLALLAAEAERYRVRLLGYCLMENHVHVIAIPADEQGLAKALGRTHYRYCQAVNRAKGRSGHLWQNRFYSCAMDRPHTWQALAYVEHGPIEAGLVRKAHMYKWSSAAAHLGKAEWPEWLDKKFWAGKWAAATWGQILGKQQETALTDRIQQCTQRGRPLVNERTLAKMEAELNRRLRPLPVGRPTKEVEATQGARKKKRR